MLVLAGPKVIPVLKEAASQINGSRKYEIQIEEFKNIELLNPGFSDYQFYVFCDFQLRGVFYPNVSKEDEES